MNLVKQHPAQITALAHSYPAWITLCCVALICLMLAPKAQAEDWIYTTRPGDTLWDISKDYLKSANYWQRLQQYNNITNAKQIPPGTRIRAPLEWLKTPPSPAQAVKVSGPASITLVDGKPTALTEGMMLPAGSIIETGAGASVTLNFSDGSTLLLQEQSQLILDSLSTYRDTGMVDTRMRLQKGRVDTKVIPFKAPGGRYEITTPAAVAAVRGTQFRVSADENKALMRSEVIRGKVVVEGAGVSQEVNGGFGTVAEAGKAPLPPRKLLSEPNLFDLPEELKQVPVTFSWPALEGAVNYRAQLASDRNFDALLQDTVFSSPQASWPELKDGDYVLRVRAVDELGLEGLNASHSFTLATRLSPPYTTTPPDGMMQAAGWPPTFKWRIVAGASAYRFQLAKQIEFGSPVIDAIISETEYTPEHDLAPGRYYWRLASQNSRGDESEFGPGYGFTILPLSSGR